MSLRVLKFGSRGVSAEIALTLCLAGWLCLTAGCAGFDLKKRIPWGEGKNGEFQPPLKVATFWTEAIMNRPDAPGLRGFGGRLLFYGKDPNKPIKVKGSLVVYAFDETNRDPTNVVPDRKYVFTAEQLELHYSKNDLGHSYSVWLPWDEVNGPSKEISLIARFSPEKGGLILSEQTKHRLPGMPEKPAPEQPSGNTPAEMPQPLPDIARSNSYPIQQAAFMEAAGSGAGAKPSTSPVSVATANTSSQVNVISSTPSENSSADITEMARQMTTTTIRYHQPPRARWTLPDHQPAAAPATLPMPQTAVPQPVLQQPMVPQVQMVPGVTNYQPSVQVPMQPQMVPQYVAPQAVLPQSQGTIPTVGYTGQSQAALSPVMATGVPAAQPQAVAAPVMQTQVYQQAPQIYQATPPQPATHSAPERLRPLGEPIARLERGHAPWQPRRAEPPYAHPFQP